MTSISILFVNESLSGGGAERQMLELARRWTDAGHEVRLATWASPQVADDYALSGVVERIHLRKKERGQSLFDRLSLTALSWLRLVSTINRVKPSLVISFSEVSNAMTYMAARVASRPVMLCIRTNPQIAIANHGKWKRLILAAYRNANTVAVQTKDVADWCRATCGRNAVIVPNLLRDLPAAPGPEDRPLNIMAVASLRPLKGHDGLIWAFAQVHDQHPEWRLALYGKGPEQPKLESLAKELGIASRVDFHGFTQDIERAMASGSIFALTSRWEGYPNALIEAMGMGLAAVSTDCDYGPREIIDDGRNGILVPVDDRDALAAAMSRLMGDKALRARMSAEAQEVRMRFHADKVMPLWNAAMMATIARQPEFACPGSETP